MGKKLIYIVLATLVLIGGGVFLATRNQNVVADSTLPKVEPSEVELTPKSYDIGRVLMKNGLVIREYEIKNTSKSILRVKNIVTSCMCTRAQIVAGDKRTRLYSMEMQGAVNPNVNFDIPPETTAKLIVKFDPAAHGPAGVGKIDRVVSVTFLAPIGTREVTFSGEVALQ